MKSLDLSNTYINNLYILKRDYTKQVGRTWWICECQDCGQHFSMRSDKIKLGQRSCGCNKGNNLVGQRFGHLIVLQKMPIKENEKRRKYQCKCDCGSIIEVLPYSLTNGLTTSCGCIKSKGEDLIAQLLSNAKIPYEREKSFENCRYKDTNRLARFDFYVDNKYIIEFDGKQHFESYGSGWFTPETHKKVVEHDEYKNQWCKDNNIPLIRIPYTKLANLSLSDLLYQEDIIYE